MKKILFVFCLIWLMILISYPTYAIDCKVVLTNDYSINDKFYKTLGESIPLLPTTSSVFKKEYFSINLFLTDYKIAKNNYARVDYDIRIINPEGKVYFEKQNLRALNAKVPKPNIILGAENTVKICFEPEDKFGEYTIEIRLKDNVARISKDYKSVITLINFEYKKLFDDDQSFTRWMNSYYKSPSPEKVIDAYLYYSQSKLSEKSSAFLPTFSFFLEIFNNNSYQFPYLTNLYESQSLKTKIYIIYLLQYSNYDLSDLTKKMSKEENETYQKILTEHLPDPYGEINNPSQLDMLWGIFMANGGYRPILKIVNTLELSEYKGYLKKYKDSDKTEEDRKKAVYDSLYQAAHWSLKSNCSQHSLVRDYCNYIYENEKISTTVRAELKEILGK